MRSEIQNYDPNRTSFNPAGYDQHTVTNSVYKLVPPGDNIVRLLMRVSGGPIRLRDDSVDPTSTQGFPLLKDEAMIFDSKFSDIRVIKDISATTDPVIDLLWYN